PEPDVGLGLPIRGNVRGPGAVELVARRARLQRIASRLEPGGRKRKAALCVADDADRDRRAVFFRADDDAFHRAFVGGAHLARQRRVGLSAASLRAGVNGKKSETSRACGKPNDGIHLALLSWTGSGYSPPDPRGLQRTHEKTVCCSASRPSPPRTGAIP